MLCDLVIMGSLPMELGEDIILIGNVRLSRFSSAWIAVYGHQYGWGSIQARYTSTADDFYLHYLINIHLVNLASINSP